MAEKLVVVAVNGQPSEAVVLQTLVDPSPFLKRRTAEYADWDYSQSVRSCSLDLVGRTRSATNC